MWVVGTRGSALARWQAKHVVETLRGRNASIELEERVIRTEDTGLVRCHVGELGRTGYVATRIDVWGRRLEIRIDPDAAPIIFDVRLLELHSFCVGHAPGRQEQGLGLQTYGSLRSV